MRLLCPAPAAPCRAPPQLAASGDNAAGKGEGEGEGHGKADVLAFGLVLWEMATVCQRHGHHSIAKH